MLTRKIYPLYADHKASYPEWDMATLCLRGWRPAEPTRVDAKASCRLCRLRFAQQGMIQTKRKLPPELLNKYLDNYIKAVSIVFSYSFCFSDLNLNGMASL